jgi:hypothetical protein
MKRQWTVQDEINLIKWIDDKGFRLVFIPSVEEWGFYHVDKPTEINGGFDRLVDLKQYMVNLKGDTNVCIILPETDYQKMAQARRVLNLH